MVRERLTLGRPALNLDCDIWKSTRREEPASILRFQWGEELSLARLGLDSSARTRALHFPADLGVQAESVRVLLSFPPDGILLATRPAEQLFRAPRFRMLPQLPRLRGPADPRLVTRLDLEIRPDRDAVRDVHATGADRDRTAQNQFAPDRRRRDVRLRPRPRVPL